MLSVLIPVYNFDVRHFVYELHKQLIESGKEHEIIIADDASIPQYKALLAEIECLPLVRVILLENNFGRAKIRNFLANQAQYANLLFVDCDSAIPGNDYINQYLSYCPVDGVVCGGRIYTENPPDNQLLLLRWLCGTKREVFPASARNENPCKSFMSNNFLISARVFHRVGFNENITGYGHEDTLFGIELYRKKISIFHIDNPLVHIGLEENVAFLEKTKQGIANLVRLYKNPEINPFIVQYVTLTKRYHQFKKYGLTILISLLYPLFSEMIQKNLLSAKPRLLLFDMFKLYHLIRKV